MNSPRVVLITGTSSGIGYATSLAFLKRGDHVIGTARDLASLDGLVAEANALPTPHGEFVPLAADVRDPVAMQAAVEQAVARFGRLDVLVANAGVGHRGGVTEAKWEDVELLMQTNIYGVLHSIRAAVPAMKISGGGQIVLLLSVTYNMTVPYAAYYAASKAFVTSIGRALRLELEADKIGVIEMIVGRTDTSFNQNRLGGARTGDGIPRMKPEQVAEGIVKAINGRRRWVALRFFDRLTIFANIFFPEYIGRVALRQYK
ncbi:MAG: SDR family NAD(P)-dependent oxidoreductase [Phototrophicaceae bacterium]